MSQRTDDFSRFWRDFDFDLPEIKGWAAVVKTQSLKRLCYATLHSFCLCYRCSSILICEEIGCLVEVCTLPQSLQGCCKLSSRLQSLR